MTALPKRPSELPGVSENSEKSLPKKKKRSLVFPLEYWKTVPHWRVLEAEIDEAIWQSAKEADMEYERKRIAKVRELEREKLEEKNKKEDEEEVKVNKTKNSKPEESEELKKAKLEKLKATRLRFYEKKRQQKLIEDARRKKEREELLRKYENGEL